MTRGFVLGKFMPPHAGHMELCETAAASCDELTVLVCWLPDDPIPGEMRLSWMKELFPRARVIGHDAVVPQLPEDDPDFWEIWKGIVKTAHPEQIDYVFAGELYGQRLAQEVGAKFIPVGGRIMGEDQSGLGGVSASAIRNDPLGQWQWLPGPVRKSACQTICLHGVESTGKTMLGEKLSRHFGTSVVPEYGRIYCELNGTELTSDELLHIGATQAAMTAAAAPWGSGRLIIDTDALMTAAWHEMMLGEGRAELTQFPPADLYLLLDPDVPWVDDGTRIYGEDETRQRFAKIAEDVLIRAGVPYQKISGTSWAAREEAAIKAIEDMPPHRPWG
ncbi:AAA family ATPase [Parvularcula marina]|uniref:AsnC family transcriptional regulator n=1 Tax=Parvularcula marina TaxID=2292771 RepID=A0A371RH55_9PROT|nr:AAA family ATPase [Parvularcula marina]RFB04788.1 AsnC family transcriptional regulator [Parvularcula marina]